MAESSISARPPPQGNSGLGTPDVPEAKKPYGQILREEIVEGTQAIRRPFWGLFLSGLSAGLDIGFSLLLMAAVKAHAAELTSFGEEALVANMYSVGFIFVTLGRSELFTEHTTLAVLPVLHRKASLSALARLWTVVYVSNLIGGAIFAALAVIAGPRLGIVELPIFAAIARRIVEHPGPAILLSAVLAGWLMGLMSWLVTAARDTISQIVLVWLIATAIGFLHLHHAIVGSVEVLAGVFSDQGIAWADYGHFLGWTTLGNALGGTIFVAVIKYSHATQVPAAEASE